MRLWRWFWGGGESAEHRTLRARCEALGYALPRSLAETAADWPRVAARKRRVVRWRRPDPEDYAWFGAVVKVFADSLYAVATPDGETWIMGERLFSGFPDPDTYMIVFLDPESRVIAAADLTYLPAAWAMPPDHSVAQPSGPPSATIRPCRRGNGDAPHASP